MSRQYVRDDKNVLRALEFYDNVKYKQKKSKTKN